MDNRRGTENQGEGEPPGSDHSAHLGGVRVSPMGDDLLEEENKEGHVEQGANLEGNEIDETIEARRKRRRRYKRVSDRIVSDLGVDILLALGLGPIAPLALTEVDSHFHDRLHPWG